MDIGILDNIILFGGIQAFSLCIYLIFRHSENKQAKWHFIFFLLCLSIYNMGYAAIFMDFHIGSLPAGAQPIPYKYLIAPFLFGYISYCIHIGNRKTRITLWLLCIPAIIYGLVRVYWVYLIVSGKNPMIIRDVFDTGFFTINEIAYLSFNLILGYLMLRKTKSFLSKAGSAFGTKKNWTWLKTLSTVFLYLSAAHLLLIALSFIVVGEHHRIFYYPTLIINSLFVYWIGFIGYSKPHLLFFKPLVKLRASAPKRHPLDEKLRKVMEEDKAFKNPKLTSQQLAEMLEVPMYELTRYLNDHLGYNVSQYLNKYRTEEAIKLMSTELSNKYTLEALAKDAGFNSKSSFYKVFKENTGKTPAAFSKSIK